MVSRPRASAPNPWVVRIGGAGAIGVTVWVFLGVSAGCVASGSATGTACPSYALGDPWILQGERAVAALLGMTFLVVVLCRLLWQGRLPDKISRDGAEWTLADESRRGLAVLERLVKTQGNAIKRLTDLVKKVPPE